MGLDVDNHLDAVKRTVSFLKYDGRPAAAVAIARRYPTTAADLWLAVTDSERIPRWFMPISGDLKLGGRYQLQGNASGLITACEQASHFALTWEFGGDVSWVEVRCAADKAEGAWLTLTHTSHLSEHWDKYGPGAVGVGWELAFMGLALYLATPTKPKLDEATFVASTEGRTLIAGSSAGWERAAIAAGADPDAARTAAIRTTAFYTGEAVGAT